jgi:hypothetical protein
VRRGVPSTAGLGESRTDLRTLRFGGADLRREAGTPPRKLDPEGGAEGAVRANENRLVVDADAELDNLGQVFTQAGASLERRDRGRATNRVIIRTVSVASRPSADRSVVGGTDRP